MHVILCKLWKKCPSHQQTLFLVHKDMDANALNLIKLVVVITQESILWPCIMPNGISVSPWVMLRNISVPPSGTVSTTTRHCLLRGEDSGRTKVQGFCNCSRRRLSYFGVRKWLFAAVEIIRVALEFSSVFCLSLAAFHLGQKSKKVPTYATELFVLKFIIDICNSLSLTQNASSSVVEWLGNLNRHPCSCGPC